MLAPFSTRVDWDDLRHQRQQHIDKQNIRENTNRKPHNYAVNDQILILDKDITSKLSPTVLNEGPWKIVGVHVNGTVTILRNGYNEVINVRRLRPYLS